jgi:hypothetical protein
VNCELNIELDDMNHGNHEAIDLILLSPKSLSWHRLSDSRANRGSTENRRGNEYKNA